MCVLRLQPSTTVTTTSQIFSKKTRRKQRPRPPKLQEQRPAHRPIFNTSAVEPRRKLSSDSDSRQMPNENPNQTMPVLGARSTRGSIASSKSDDERKEKEDSGTESDQI